MAFMAVSPDQYILGGISAPSTSISEAFQAGAQANLNRQVSREQMRSNEQLMQLRVAQEQRAQEQFELQKQQAGEAAARAARAAAQDAERRRLMAQYGGAFIGGAPGLVTGAPGVGVSVPSPAGAVPAAPTGPSPAGAVPAAPTGPSPAIDMMPTGSVPAPPTRSYMTPGSMTERAAIAAMPTVGQLPYQTTADPVQVEMQNAAIQRQIADLDATMEAASYGLNAPGSRADPVATIQMIGRLRQQREALVAQLQDVTYAPPSRDFFAEEGPGAAGVPFVPTPAGAGLREPGSDSPVDYVLSQPAGSGTPAPTIPREPPRINAAITQGFSERERLVEAYNAFTSAGLLEDSQNFLNRINALDQTLIRLQGEQAINDLQLGYVERASQLLSYYYGADVQVQPVLNSEGKYDMYVDGQPVKNDDFIDLRPDQMGDILRPFFDTQYRDAMAEGRESYLTERAKKQAERDMAEAENPGFKVDRELTGYAPDGGNALLMVDSKGDYRLVWFVAGEYGSLQPDFQELTQEQVRTMMTQRPAEGQ